MHYKCGALKLHRGEVNHINICSVFTVEVSLSQLPRQTAFVQSFRLPNTLIYICKSYSRTKSDVRTNMLWSCDLRRQFIEYVIYNTVFQLTFGIVPDCRPPQQLINFHVLRKFRFSYMKKFDVTHKTSCHTLTNCVYHAVFSLFFSILARADERERESEIALDSGFQ